MHFDLLDTSPAAVKEGKSSQPHPILQHAHADSEEICLPNYLWE